MIDPWKERAGLWLENTPEWVRILGTIATTEHVKYNPSVAGPRSDECR
jgi:hypothetical protein